MTKLFKVDSILKTRNLIFVELLRNGKLSELKIQRHQFESWLERTGRLKNMTLEAYWASYKSYKDLDVYITIEYGAGFFKATKCSLKEICSVYSLN